MGDLVTKLKWCPTCQEGHLNGEVGDLCEKCGTELTEVPPYTVPLVK